MQNRRALVVADSAGQPEAVATILGRFGFTVIVPAPGVTQAIAKLRAEPFDLVVLPLQGVEQAQLVALEQAMRARPAACVIGTAPKADPDLILRAMRAGVHEFLVYPPSVSDLSGAVERLLRRAGAALPAGQVIAVYSGKGGMGSTSIAVNVAQAFAEGRRKGSVALADLVVTGGDVRTFLNLRPSYDVGDLVAKLGEVDADLLNSLMSAGPHGLSVLPASDSAEFDDVFGAGSIGAVVEQLRGNFAVTVIDCEHHLSERTVTILDAADRILLVTQLTVPALHSAQRSLDLFRRLGYEQDKLCVVVNRYQSSDAITLANAAESLKCKVFWSFPNDYRSAAAAVDKGIPVMDEASGSKLAQSYAKLAKQLVSTGPAVQEPVVRLAPQGSRLRNLFGFNSGGGMANVT